MGVEFLALALGPLVVFRVFRLITTESALIGLALTARAARAENRIALVTGTAGCRF